MKPNGLEAGTYRGWDWTPKGLEAGTHMGWRLEPKGHEVGTATSPYALILCYWRSNTISITLLAVQATVWKNLEVGLSMVGKIFGGAKPPQAPDTRRLWLFYFFLFKVCVRFSLSRILRFYAFIL